MRSNSELNGIARHQSPPRSEVCLTNSSGTGSTNGSVRLFTVIQKSIGAALRGVNDPAVGSYVQVNMDGVYCISYDDVQPAAISSAFAINLNNVSGAGNVPAATLIASQFANGAGQNNTCNMTCITNLKAGDIVYGVVSIGQTDDAPFNRFRVTQIA